MIHVIDYGLGNVQAFLTLYKRLGFEATRAKTAADLAGRPLIAQTPLPRATEVYG